MLRKVSRIAGKTEGPAAARRGSIARGVISERDY
jgi:hypothetical protein